MIITIGIPEKNIVHKHVSTISFEICSREYHYQGINLQFEYLDDPCLTPIVEFVIVRPRILVVTLYIAAMAN